MIDAMVEMRAELEALKNTIGRMIQVGTVEVRDPEKGYRLKYGESEDGKPFLSPFLPHPETGKTSIPLKKGQIAVAINPGGDPRQGLLVRGGYSDEHKSPNEDLDANVFEDAGVKVTVKGGKLIIKAGGTTVTIGPDGVTFEGGEVKHDGKNIGSTHVHGGVLTGRQDTDVPSN